MGMSLADFSSCTPAEFYEVYAHWREKEELRDRSSWEQVRVLCAHVLRPWVRKRLKAEDVFALPWDGGGKPSETEVLTEEERKARYEAAKKRYGIIG